MIAADTLDEERAHADKLLSKGTYFRRVPASAVRLELCEESHRHWTIRAVPSMREVVTFENEGVAREVFAALSSTLEVQHRDRTRPDGTCPRCSGALEKRFESIAGPHHRWCPFCMAYVLPAGARE